VQGTLVLPSNIGGAHWGGVTFDPERGLAIVPVNTIGSVITLIPRDQYRRDLPMSGSRIAADDAAMAGTPYVLGRQFFLTEDGGICTPPPHGLLVAVDLVAGRIAWSTPLGTAEGLEAHFPNAAQGFINLGGATTTAGGVTFIGAAPDGYFRAFDTSTGKELWRFKLPAGARSTPMTYEGGDHRQYVVIAAGGDGEDLFGRGDEFVAFALPRHKR
jgi:quinoprotein glucose dehydrogenase